MATEYFNDAWRIPNNKNQSLVSNYSMDFDGSNTYVDLGSDVLFDSTKGFSLSAWVNLNSYSPAFPGICRIKTDQSKGFIIFLSQTSPYQGVNIGSVSGFMRAKTVGNISGDFIGTWKHVCVTFDGVDRTNTSSYKIFIDGSSVDLTTTGAFSDSPNANFLGNATTNSATYLNGKIDQVSIFDYALPATGTNSIATLYGGGTVVTNPMGLSPAPVAYYQLGDQTASNNTTEPDPPVQSYLVPNNSLQDYVFLFPNNARVSIPTKTISLKATISLWINYNALGVGSAGTVVVGGVGQNYWPYIENSSGKFVFYIDSSFSTFRSAITTVDVVLNKWFHIALSDDGVNTKAYINGVPEATMTSVVDTVINTIGSYSTGGFSVDGMMSNVAYWQDTNLSDAQILSIYNNGTPNDISSLSPTSWYKLNAQDTFDGTDWTIKDYAGSNDGTSINMTSANLVQSNLQHTSGYSPYALSLDASIANQFILSNAGNGILNGATSFTVSAWINPSADTGNPQNIFANWIGNIMIRFSTTESIQTYYAGLTVGQVITNSGSITYGEWQHIVVTYSGSEIKIYRNNIELNSVLATGTLASAAGTGVIGNRPSTTQYFNGKMSNLAIWKNSVIDVNTLYNQGVPADLTSLSPTGWWQLGSNSSFNSGVWTCLNQGTGSTSAVPANATSTNTMTEDDITNGVGYSGNGLGTSSIEIIGDAPYSTANGISENMDVLDRTTDVPPTV